jgi:hypothetical protein
MQYDGLLAPISETGQRVLDLVKKDPGQASEIMESLSKDQQIALISHEASVDPKVAQELIFLVSDDYGKEIVEGLSDKSLFRIMKSQTSTHIGVLSLLNPQRVQSVLDLDPELFSTKGVTDPQTAYHWMVSFLEEDDEVFASVLHSLDIKVVASAFQDKILLAFNKTDDKADPDEESAFPADFLVKLDRGELNPNDLELADEETHDILTKIHLTNQAYFNELVSLMLRDEDLKTRTAEEALDRMSEQVGDLSKVTAEAEDMFVPLDE